MLSTPRLSRAAGVHQATALIGIVLALAYLCTLAWAMDNVSYDIWGAMVVGPILVAISIPILERAGRADPDPRMARILYAAFAAKRDAEFSGRWALSKGLQRSDSGEESPKDKEQR